MGEAPLHPHPIAHLPPPFHSFHWGNKLFRSLCCPSAPLFPGTFGCDKTHHPVTPKCAWEDHSLAID